MADVLTEKENSQSRRGNGIVYIGDIKYEQKNSRIEVNGQLTNISGQAKKILDYLIEHNQRSVTRQELSVLLWGTEDIPENRFYQAIKGLRKTLGDTLPWKIIDSPAKNLITLKPEVKLGRAKGTIEKVLLSRNIILLILFLLISISILIFSFSSENKLDVLDTYTVQESEYLTDTEGDKSYAAISPDGSVLLFNQKEGRNRPTDLVAKRLKNHHRSGGIKILATGEKNQYNAEPSFSPSGKYISWVKTDYRSYCDVMVAEFDSDNLSIHQTHSVADCSNKGFARTPQWKDETTLLVAMPQQNNRPNGIEEIDLLTQKRKIIVEPNQSEKGVYHLSYNRHSRKLAYLSQSVNQGTGTELRVYDFNNNVDYLLKFYPHVLFPVAWLDEENIVARNNEEYEVINLDGLTTPLLLENPELLSFSFAIKKNIIGFVKGKPLNRNIFIHNLLTGEKDKTLSSPEWDSSVVVAKLSGDIVFVSKRGNQQQLYFVRNGQITPVKKFRNRDHVIDITISPDGNFIAYMLSNQLNVIDNRGNLHFRKNMPTLGMAFSYDNKQFVVGARRKDKFELISFSIQENFKPTFITDGFMPKVMQNGDIYFFENLGDGKFPTLSKISPERNVSRFSSETFKLFRSTSHDVIDGYLYYVDGLSETKQLVQKNIESGEINVLYPISSIYFSIGASDSQLLFTESESVHNNFVKFKISR